MDKRIIKVLKAISSFLLAMAVVLAFFISGIRLLGFQVFGVLSGSMEPTYPTGSLIYVKSVEQNELHVNDIITFRLSPSVIATHRIVELVQDENNNLYISVMTAGKSWPFLVSPDGLKYRNGFGKLTDLEKVNAYGFKDNLSFGSGRGYIWSRTLGMLKDDFIIGDGANTYCINFPHASLSAWPGSNPRLRASERIAVISGSSRVSSGPSSCAVSRNSLVL